MSEKGKQIIGYIIKAKKKRIGDTKAKGSESAKVVHVCLSGCTRERGRSLAGRVALTAA